MVMVTISDRFVVISTDDSDRGLVHLFDIIRQEKRLVERSIADKAIEGIQQTYDFVNAARTTNGAIYKFIKEVYESLTMKQQKELKRTLWSEFCVKIIDEWVYSSIDTSSRQIILVFDNAWAIERAFKRINDVFKEQRKQLKTNKN